MPEIRDKLRVICHSLRMKTWDHLDPFALADLHSRIRKLPSAEKISVMADSDLEGLRKRLDRLLFDIDRHDNPRSHARATRYWAETNLPPRRKPLVASNLSKKASSLIPVSLMQKLQRAFENGGWYGRSLTPTDPRTAIYTTTGIDSPLRPSEHYGRSVAFSRMEAEMIAALTDQDLIDAGLLVRLPVSGQITWSENVSKELPSQAVASNWYGISKKADKVQEVQEVAMDTDITPNDHERAKEIAAKHGFRAWDDNANDYGHGFYGWHNGKKSTAMFDVLDNGMSSVHAPFANHDLLEQRIESMSPDFEAAGFELIGSERTEPNSRTVFYSKKPHTASRR